MVKFPLCVDKLSAELSEVKTERDRLSNECAELRNQKDNYMDECNRLRRSFKGKSGSFLHDLKYPA
jgi:uncharacterized coiled-coil DUF342 family protein